MPIAFCPGRSHVRDLSSRLGPRPIAYRPMPISCRPSSFPANPLVVDEDGSSTRSRLHEASVLTLLLLRNGAVAGCLRRYVDREQLVLAAT